MALVMGAGCGYLENCNFYSWKGILSLNRVSDSAKKRIQKEFSILVPQKIWTPKKNELQYSDLLALFLKNSINYMIGISLLTSHNFQGSIEFFELVDLRLNNDLNDELRKMVKNSLLAAYILDTEKTFDLWYKFQNDNTIHKYLKQSFKKTLELSKNQYQIHIKYAIFRYKTGDLQGAQKQIEICSTISKGDDTWKFSKAFLYSCEGNLTEAYRIYSRLEDKTYDEKQVIFVEDFILNDIELTDQTQHYYLLVLLNYYIKKDYMLTSEYISEFFDKNDNHEYHDSRKHCSKIQDELNQYF